MREGAFDFLQKPYEPEQLVEVIERAARQTRMRRELVELRRRLDGGAEQLATRLLGSSEIMEDLRNLVLDIADVIILGETGTGNRWRSRMVVPDVILMP